MVNHPRPDSSAPVGGPGAPTLHLAFARLAQALNGYLPTGRALPPIVWQRRHRGVTRLLWLHVAGVLAFGLWVGAGPAGADVRVRPASGC